MVTAATVDSDVRNFAYTADDERIAVRRGSSWTWTVRDQSGKVLRELTSLETSNPFGLTAHAWSKDYVFRDGLLLASISIPAGASTPTTYHYHLDHLGSPRMITRDGGTVVSMHNYYPFGAEMALTPQENPAEAMKFTGHERDIVAGSDHSVDYMHARYYNGNLGRFLSVDPGPYHPEEPQTWNRYAYVGNNPISFSDATGRERGRYGPPPKLAPGAVREAAHKIDQFLTRVGQVVMDGVFLGGVFEAVVENGDVELVQPAAEKLESDAEVILAEDAIAVRGGLNQPDNFSNGSGVVEHPNGTLSGVSVQSANGQTVQELSQNIPNGQVGVSTAGQIRAAGGTITPDPQRNNPSHCLICDLTDKILSDLFTPTIRNPNK